jgi:hypothetical protein
VIAVYLGALKVKLTALPGGQPSARRRAEVGYQKQSDVYVGVAYIKLAALPGAALPGA